MKPHPLKVERELRGWSQAKVAEAVGTNVRTVIRWEQGQTLPYPYYRERLCELYGKNARELGLLDNAADVEVANNQDGRGQNAIGADAMNRVPTRNFDAVPSTAASLWKVPPVFMPLVGRAREIDEIKALLVADEVRLLTLTGPGGIGKTRLSIQLAHELWPLFADGICFVSLTAASAPEHVAPIISRELDIQDENAPARERVQNFLRDRQMLLVLDNFEQIIEAAPELEQLLVACPRVKLLVTSRIVLHLAAEHQYRVAPLAIPGLNTLPDSATVAHFASVELFVQRARTLLPSFQVTEVNAAALAEICVRLDGIPLAIELAAARVKLLPPNALLPRLSRSLEVLTKGLPSLPERHQTLRNTIRWSYDLLDNGEQRLFRLLSIFVGGFTLEAAESLFEIVARGDESITATALDGLDSLIDKSLLQPAGPTDDTGETRLEMLETIREFGKEGLLKEGEMDLARQAHARCYLEFAEQVARELTGQQQAKWLDRLDREHGNLQAAMEWMLARQEKDEGGRMPVDRQSMALLMGNALGWFWMPRGYLKEGQEFLEQALNGYTGGVTEVQARVYMLATELMMRLGNLERAEMLIEQSINSYNELGNKSNLADSIRLAGWLAHQKGKVARAYDLYQQSLALFKAVNNQHGIAHTLLNMAFIMQTQGNYEQARVLLEEVVTRQRALQNKRGTFSALYQLAQVLFGADENAPLHRILALLNEGLDLAEEVGDRRGAAAIRGLTGWVVFSQGKLDEAQRLVEECVRFYKEGGERQLMVQYLTLLGEISTAQGEYASASSSFAESMAMGKEAGDGAEIVAQSLEGMAGLAMAQGNHMWAVRLWAAAERLRAEIGMALMPRFAIQREGALDEMREFLGARAFTDLWEEGRTLSPDEVMSARHRPLPNQQTESIAIPTRPKKNFAAYPAGLSAREVEVLRLVALGLSDAVVAERLVLSPRTVTTHLTSIYNKLGINSRSAAVRFAADHHLL